MTLHLCCLSLDDTLRWLAVLRAATSGVYSVRRTSDVSDRGVPRSVQNGGTGFSALDITVRLGPWELPGFPWSIPIEGYGRQEEEEVAGEEWEGEVVVEARELGGVEFGVQIYERTTQISITGTKCHANLNLNVRMGRTFTNGPKMDAAFFKKKSKNRVDVEKKNGRVWVSPGGFTHH